MTKVLVYGTLRKDESNHALLDNDASKFIEEVEVPGQMFSVQGRYPIVVVEGCADFKDLGIKKETIKCELWEVEDWVEDMMDSLEGIKYGLYQKHHIKVLGHKCLIYIPGTDLSNNYIGKEHRIKSGDWKKRK